MIWNKFHSFVIKFCSTLKESAFIEKLSIGSREKKYSLFLSTMRPRYKDRILDIGVSPLIHLGIRSNFLEKMLPEKYLDQITAVGIDDMTFFKKKFKIKTVRADAKKLPFKDNVFDMVFSNAVIEHVGDFQEQKKFVSEIMRVSKKVFITTPNKLFPIDNHVMLPFIHWLPMKIREKAYISFTSYTKEKVNLLTPRAFKKLFTEIGYSVKIYKGFLHMTLIAIYKK